MSSPSPIRNSVIKSPASTFALAKWPASGLDTRDVLRSPAVTCTAQYPSFITVLTCVIRLDCASITVTGIESPSSVKTRVIPHLRPTRLINRLQNAAQTLFQTRHQNFSLAISPAFAVISTNGQYTTFTNHLDTRKGQPSQNNHYHVLFLRADPTPVKPVVRDLPSTLSFF